MAHFVLIKIVAYCPIKCMKAKENHDTHCSLLISPQAEPDLAKSWELLLEKHGGSKKKSTVFRHSQHPSALTYAWHA
ncbi:hypothetical protein C4K18_2084 [Pseudomonas chlororaphis subsp. aurantiaca]|nr:hypothetical protein C4K18_2084 [Pseudomonas chlororaphis subsp. aurantiaca]